jgi:outer membrane protein TolC
MRLLRALAALPLLAAALAAAEPALLLSRKEAIGLALSKGLFPQAAVQKRAFIRAGVNLEQGAFDWSLVGSLSASKLEGEDTNPRTSGLNNLFLSDTRVTAFNRSFLAGVEKPLATGGTLSLSVAPSYGFQQVTQLNQNFGNPTVYPVGYDTINPYGGRVTLSLTQPLLRGFGSRATEARLRAAEFLAKAGDQDYQRALIQEIAFVDGLYWDFVFTRQNLFNKQQAQKLAQEQLGEDRERVASGMLAPLELPAVEAVALERAAQVLAAEAGMTTARTRLAAELFPDQPLPSDIVPTDAPELEPMEMGLEDAERLALVQRPELKAALSGIEARRELELDSKNRTLPQLDALAAYSGGAASGAGLNGVLSDWGAQRYPGYALSLQLRVPIGNHAAKAVLAQRRAQRLESELDHRALRQIVLLEVRQAHNDLRSTAKTVEALGKALEFREKSLEAEDTKLENGLSTSFFVLQRQDELDQARTALAQAKIAFRKAQTAFYKAIGSLGEELRKP